MQVAKTAGIICSGPIFGVKNPLAWFYMSWKIYLLRTARTCSNAFRKRYFHSYSAF